MDPELIAQLERLLSDARMGLVESVAVIAEYRDRYQTYWSCLSHAEARDLVAWLSAALVAEQRDGRAGVVLAN